MGLFSPAAFLANPLGVLGSSGSSSYTPSLDASATPTDNSDYTDSGTLQNGLSTLDTALNDAFKAYTIAQTPVSYRAAAPTSPAIIQANATASAKKSTNTILTIGIVLVVILLVWMLVKKK